MERRHGAAKHVEGIWWLSSKGVNCWIFLNLAVNFYELVTIDYIYIYIYISPLLQDGFVFQIMRSWNFTSLCQVHLEND